MVTLGELEDFDAEGFTQFTEKEGSSFIDFMDDPQEIRYKAICFINRAGTIAYAETFIQGKHDYIFLSKTKQGDVLTLSGDKAGPLPLRLQGVYAIHTVPDRSHPEAFYAQHMSALREEKAIADPTWLKEMAPTLPQKAIDISMIAVNQFIQSFGGMDGLVDVMGDLVGKMARGGGDAMATVGDTSIELDGEDMPDVGPHDEASSRSAVPSRPGTKKRSAPKAKAPTKSGPASRTRSAPRGSARARPKRSKARPVKRKR